MSSSTQPTSRRSTTTNTCPAASNTSLRDKLAAVLPEGCKFGIHHVSTPPTRTEPLCVAPPGHRPDKTYRESHFLAVSVRPSDNNVPLPVKRASPGADQARETTQPRKQALAFAIEVLIFTTAYQTTLFVSKADSTGYLHLLSLPKGSPSPIRQVCAVFLAYLLDHRQRKHVQSVVNLFARAQAQYLFPGSVRNRGKHVLDDWGLVKWWCKVLNPVMEGLSKQSWGRTKGYLLVPGLEETEMRAFIPRTAASMQNWDIGHPLERISHYTRDLASVPPRCLIPGYPDDPKSRFRDELDEEVSSRKQGIAAWKSVRSLGQFWEMMSFRQECSSGRLTGFIWLVFDPKSDRSLWSLSPAAAPAAANLTMTPNASFDSSLAPFPPATPPRRRVDVASNTPQASPLKAPPSPTAPRDVSAKAARRKTKKAKKTRLSGRITPRTPKVKTQARNRLANRPTANAYYYWPREGRGDRMADEAEYKRIVELLLHLDFSTFDKAAGSTQRWLSEAGIGDGVEAEVVGRAVVSAPPGADAGAPGASEGKVTNLTGLIRRKSAPKPSETDLCQPLDLNPKVPDRPSADSSTAREVNVLGASLVRKRKKNVEDAPR